MKILNDLRYIREQWNLTTRDLEEILHVHTGKVSHWENGSEIPSAKTLLKWADALGCELRVEIKK